MADRKSSNKSLEKFLRTSRNVWLCRCRVFFTVFFCLFSWKISSNSGTEIGSILWLPVDKIRKCPKEKIAPFQSFIVLKWSIEKQTCKVKIVCFKFLNEKSIQYCIVILKLSVKSFKNLNAIVVRNIIYMYYFNEFSGVKCAFMLANCGQKCTSKIHVFQISIDLYELKNLDTISVCLKWIDFVYVRKQKRSCLWNCYLLIFEIDFWIFTSSIAQWSSLCLNRAKFVL